MSLALNQITKQVNKCTNTKKGVTWL